MAEKIINTRIINKHAVESDWLKAVNFTPKQGELIVYDKDSTYDYERFKIGDGTTNINDLPFATYKSVPEMDANGVLTFNSEYDVNYDTPLPHVDTSDNGKILMVVDGVWTPQPLTNVAEVGA